MSKVATHFTRVVASLALGALLTTAASAALRSPQVVVNGGSLQGYLNSKGESINVLTDQDAAQTLTSTVSGNSTFTLMIEFAGNAGSNSYGIYNGGDVAPALYQVFPGAAAAGWFAVASFRTSPTRVVVNLFDDNAVLQGTNTYLGADRNNFGFYLQQGFGANQVLYSQDARNTGSNPQMLIYPGTGDNSGSWWLAMEDLTPAQGADNDFDDAVLFLESVNPVPTETTTWGSLKARFR
jgi:hypothetical protein